AQTAGTPFTVTVNAVDANWYLVNTVTDTVGITSTDTNATMPGNAALVAGTTTFSVTLTTSGTKTLTATDITDGTKTADTSPSITVNAGAFTKLQLLVPGETATPGTSSSGPGKTGSPNAQPAGGAAFTVTVNAVDAAWNVVSSTDTVGLTSTDLGAMPGNQALVSGTKMFSVTLRTAGSQTLTASDITTPARTPNSSVIPVTAGSFTKLQLLVPGETAAAGAASGKTGRGPFMKLQLLVPGETAAAGPGSGKTGTPTAQGTGTAFTVTVNAVDTDWYVVSSTHTVGITSSDGSATLPANAALVGGTKT